MSSARIPGTDRVLIFGHIHSEGRSLIDTDVDDIVTVDLEGNWLEGRIEPVDERFLHLEIMKARPDVTSVVHAHSTYATAFGIADVNILPVGNRGAIFAPQVPILDFDRQIDTPERGRMARDAIGEGCALVLKNHGIVVCGDSIENACITAFALEETAQLHWICRPTRAGAEDLDGRSAQRADRRAQGRILRHVWGHYSRLDPWEAHS